MGLPDNRDIEPTREESYGSYENWGEVEITMNHAAVHEEQMEIDGEESDLTNDGYLRLQMFDNGDEIPADDADSSGSEDEDENVFAAEFNAEEEEISAVPSGIPPIVPSDVELQAEVWNTPRAQEDSIELSTEKTQQILKAMSKFSLPNVPAWANEVNPSELIQRLKNKELQTPSSNGK